MRTRISSPVNNTAYGPSVWSHVLSDQLDVPQAEFWACVSDRRLPERTPAADQPPARALPADLVHQLIHTVGVPEAEVATMTLKRALTVMNEHWSRPRE